MQIIKSSKEENEVLQRLDKRISKACCLTDCEKEFINSMVLRKKPKKILEVGVAAGGSSGLILNSILEMKNDAQLYSVDFLTPYCNDSTKLTGYATLDYATEEMKKNWHLLTGKFASEFMDEIGGDIDFAFIDTVHWNPGEIIDFLMVLPYLKKGATVLFHDINLHSVTSSIEMVTNCLLMSAVRGEKLLPSRSLRTFINIGGVILDENINDYLWEVFNCLNMPWSYLPSPEQNYIITNALCKHYDEYLCNIYRKKYNYYKENDIFSNYSESSKRYSEKSYVISADDLKLYQSGKGKRLLPIRPVDTVNKIKRVADIYKIINR